MTDKQIQLPDPSVVATELLRIYRQTDWSLIRMDTPENEEPSLDVRLQVYEDGECVVRYGDPSYDPDHRGFFGAGCIVENDPGLSALAEELVEECAEMMAESGFEPIDNPNVARRKAEQERQEKERKRQDRIRELRAELETLETDDEREEAADRIARAAYWDHVRRLADEVEERIRDAIKDGDPDPDVGDFLHETIDGSHMVIYTAQNFEVLRWCSDHDAYTNEFGEAPTERDGSLNWAALAYGALMNDVRDSVADVDEIREGLETGAEETEK